MGYHINARITSALFKYHGQTLFMWYVAKAVNLKAHLSFLRVYLTTYVMTHICEEGHFSMHVITSG